MMLLMYRTAVERYGRFLDLLLKDSDLQVTLCEQQQATGVALSLSMRHVVG